MGTKVPDENEKVCRGTWECRQPLPGVTSCEVASSSSWCWHPHLSLGILICWRVTAFVPLGCCVAQECPPHGSLANLGSMSITEANLADSGLSPSYTLVSLEVAGPVAPDHGGPGM